MLLLASLGLIWYISEFLRARRLLQRAVFGLELERGRQLRNNAAIFILALTAVIGIILYVNYQVAPTLPPELLRPPTPTPDLERTPFASPSPPVIPTSTPTPPLAPTITLPSQPLVPPPIAPPATETPEPAEGDTAVTIPTLAIPPTPVIGCTLQLTISEPRNGATVSGSIEFFGTANTPDFGGYTLEANGPQTNGQWASLVGRTIAQPVVDSLLGNVNLSQWESGPYLIRLTAFNRSGEAAYQCAIQITLEN
ncbi:MAG: hypothetical protein KF770_21725 [Anaerolineae bacterium]|nr:hypothetical protein [Anaerolineae bacterium]